MYKILFFKLKSPVFNVNYRITKDTIILTISMYNIYYTLGTSITQWSVMSNFWIIKLNFSFHVVMVRDNILEDNNIRATLI